MTATLQSPPCPLEILKQYHNLLLGWLNIERTTYPRFGDATPPLEPHHLELFRFTHNGIPCVLAAVDESAIPPDFFFVVRTGLRRLFPSARRFVSTL